MAKAAKTRNGGRFIAETLQRYGVTHIFFQEAILREALIEAEALGIGRVLARSEKSAAYMADGYARTSGRTGICMAQSVGAANLAAGLQDAYLGCVPVVALTGKHPPVSQYRNAYQEVCHGPLFDAVTKARFNLDAVGQLPVLLRQAFREAASDTPGPVHIDLPDLAGRLIEMGELAAGVSADARFAVIPPFRPSPEARLLDEALALLTQAKRPALVLGGGARISGAGKAVRALAEAGGIPIVYSLSGKAVVPDSHPLCFGPVGTYAGPPGNRLLAAADLAIFLGSRTGDQTTLRWALPGRDARVIQVDINPRELGRNYENVLGLMGDVRATAEALTKELPAQPDRSAWQEQGRAWLDEWEAETAPLRRSDASPIRPERLCAEIADLLPTNGILVADTGYAAAWTANFVPLGHAEQLYLRAAGSLGWALPAAMGAKCAAPDRPVLCFTGDGGAGYHIADLETAKRCGINIVVVINNNHALAQDAHDVVGVPQIYGDRPGKPEELYKYAPIDFAAVAKAMGCRGVRVETPDRIAPALKEALAADLPTVVEVITDEAAQAPVDYVTSGRR